MNKQDNKLTLSVLAVLAAGIALVYTFIMYHDVIFAVAGMSVLFLITAYVLTQNIITFITMRNKSMNVQLKNMIDDISSQLENMSSTQTQIGKATYLFTRQTARAVTILEGNYTESQEALFKNLSYLSNTQNKTAKLMIKHDLNNTMKLISTLKEIRSQLSETMVQGFDQVTPNNDDVIATLQTIVDYLNTQSNDIDQTMGLQLDKVARELQNISSNIQKVQLSTPNVMQAAPVAPVIPEQPASQTQPVQANETSAIPEQPASQTQPVQANGTSAIPEQPVPQAQPVEEELSTEPLPESMTADITETNDTLIMETNNLADNAIMTETNDMTDDTIMAEDTSASGNIEEAIYSDDTVTGASDTISETPNTELSSATTEEPATEHPEDIEAAMEKEEDFTPTFTVVGKSEPETDSNKQLSADEIAALFAAADPAPKKAKKAEEPAKPSVEAADSNKQLSADEIAALFAAADPAPKAEEPVKEEPKAEPVDLTPVSTDPNKQLSPDEIAALFAQMG